MMMFSTNNILHCLLVGQSFFLVFHFNCKFKHENPAIDDTKTELPLYTCSHHNSQNTEDQLQYEFYRTIIHKQSPNFISTTI